MAPGMQAVRDRAPALKRQSMPRAKRAAIVGIPAFFVLAITGSASLGLIVAALIFFALYIPAWDVLPLGKWIVPLGVILIAVLYPVYQPNLFDVLIFGNFPSVDTGVTMMIFIMMALGLNIVVGYAGLLDLGYVAFYAMGAYTVAWFASQHFSNVNVHAGGVGTAPSTPGFHISIWIVLIIAGVFATIGGILIGFPTLRLRGDYLAIVTLGFGEIMPQVANNGDNLLGHNITNGPQGINPIDPPGFGDTLHNAVGLPSDYLSSTNSTRLFYWTALFLVLFTVFCSARLRDSRLGRAWIAIREDETA
ncbi:MAG: hypothetical protein E6G31_08660, partial [Actinobacteria bacterium]